MNEQREQLEQRASGAWDRLTGGNGFEVGVLAAAVVFVVLTVVATIDVGRSDYSDDLSFDGTLRETSALIKNRGSSGIATFRNASLDIGTRSAPLDSLAMTGDSTLFPSLARGGFLRDQIDLYNDHAARVAVRNLYRTEDEVLLAVGTPSVFRVARTDSGYQVLSSDLNEFSLAVPSPRRDRQWVTVRTADGGSGPSLVGMYSTIDLTQRDSVLSAPLSMSGTSCRVQRRAGARLLYCGSAAGSAVGAAFDLGFDLPDSLAFMNGARARMSRSTALFQNGARTSSPAEVKTGDLLYTRATGAMVASNTHTGVLAGQQWLNGKPSFTVGRRGTIQQLGRVGRTGGASNTGVVTLGLDAGFATDLDARVDAFMTRYGTMLQSLSIVVADIGNGEIKALSQSGVRDGEPLRAFEPVLFGSMVKPIMAAAILSQDPSLANLTVQYAGPEVTQVAGMPLRKPFGNPANGCAGTITFSLFIQCSSNQYAAELFVQSLQRSSRRRSLAADGVVPNDLLDNTPITNGLLTLFDDIDVVSSRDPGRSDRIWHYASGTTQFVPRDRSVHPWKSRPWYIDARNRGTSVDLLSRFAFGGWENRWTQIGAAEAYARIATDRRVSLTMLRQTGPVQFPTMPARATNAFRAVRGGLRDVVEHGTASGLGATFRAAGSPSDSLIVLAKTGTLNEVTARDNDDVYLKSLAVVVGKRGRTDNAPLRCGLVAVLHLEFRQDWRIAEKLSKTARLPDLHREFADRELAAALRAAWGRMSPCGVIVL